MMKKYRLPPADHQKLKSLLGRPPKNLEVVLALALWNEHCSYKSSRPHLKKLDFPTRKKVSGKAEQAGIVDLGQGERVCFKMESHNHPSFITPYHGATTGVGGILRDIFAMNARPIALANYLCFGDPKAQISSGLVDGVVRGIGDYGNCMGIPTITGQTEFSPSYNHNILVNAMALGYLGSQTKAMSAKAKGVGNYVVYAGSSTGRDGILGADMASRSFEGEKKSFRPTIQIGDPFFGKQLMEASLLAMKRAWITACQDMGAAGLACSSFEMADKGGLGLSLHLDRVPLRDQSLQPGDILLSESQERLLFICPPRHWENLKKLFEDYGLEICILGKILNQKELEIFWQGERILKTDPQFWIRKAPIENRPYVIPSPVKRLCPNEWRQAKKVKASLLKMLAQPEGVSRQFIYRQYDQRVGTQTLKDSSYPIAVVRLLESGRELALTVAGSSYLMALDVEQGAKDAVFYPALQLALRGFQPWALTDCLNFGNPEKKEAMGEFVLSVESIAKACEVLDTPIVSGNVSFYNESQGRSITPTPAIAMIGLKESHQSLAPAGFHQPKEQVYLLSSHQFFFPVVSPTESFKREKTAYGALQDPLLNGFVQQLKGMAEEGCFSSARMVGKRGLANTLARMVLERGVGFVLAKSFPFDIWEGRLYEAVVSVPKEQEKSFKWALDRWALNWDFMGETQAEPFLVLQGEAISYEEMKAQYFKPWEGYIV